MEKLNKVKPLTIAQASRISGVNPADISILLIDRKKTKYMKKRDLTKGSVINSLLIVAIPTMLTQLLNFSYNIIDLKFVSGLGTEAIAAVGSASIFIGFGFAFNALCVVGTGIKTSQASGQDNHNSYHKSLNSGLYYQYGLLTYYLELCFLHFLGNYYNY